MKTNTSTTFTTCRESRNSLILDILYSEFGSQLVSQALKYKDYYKIFKRDNTRLVSDSFDTLSYNWQMGKSREYLKSLEINLQHCLICHLAEDYINDKPRM